MDEIGEIHNDYINILRKDSNVKFILRWNRFVRENSTLFWRIFLSSCIDFLEEGIGHFDVDFIPEFDQFLNSRISAFIFFRDISKERK